LKWHLEVMTPAERRALQDIGRIATERGFYLAGGTAVALHLGHRRSVDLDFFTAGEMNDETLLAGIIREAVPRFVPGKLSPRTIYGSVRKVQCSFIGMPYPLLCPTIDMPDFGCRVADLDDLAAMKLAALAQRGAKKDFLDVFALAQKHRPLKDLLGFYRKKYGFKESAHLLNALVFFDDADDDPMPSMVWDDRWTDVRAAFRLWVKQIERDDR
jgi:hypothetical protein